MKQNNKKRFYFLTKGVYTVSKIKMDMHCHTAFSFDSEADPRELCENAVRRGITHLAITDHCDYDCIISGLYEPYLADKAKETVFSLKKEYKDRLEITYGIELGGAHAVPKEAEELVKEYGFEFVLGSLHNLRNVPDFYFMNFKDMPDGLIESLVDRNISELCEIAELPFIDSVAHITYPLRYVKAVGRNFDIEKHQARFEELLKLIIKNGKALEVNTSPYRKGIADTMPEKQLLETYRRLGGARITLGSDAHTAEGVGDGIYEAAATLKKLGFESVTIFGSFGSKREKQISITDII